jgi:REP element-mobilizing transposase RayT
MDETLFHHVTGRGVVRRELFRDEHDYVRFLKYLATAIERFAWRRHAYCLMPNHYHLLLETKPEALARGMLLLAGSYARYFNHHHKSEGHVFQGPYHAEPVARDEHLLEVHRYIANNPVRAGLCERPDGWRWSSYRATAGNAHHAPWLTVSDTRQLFEPYGGYAYFCNPVATELQPGC